MTRRSKAAAWQDFWADNAKADGGGCLPARWAGIEAAQRKAWKTFAAKLPRKARVLDLATGDGRVLKWIRQQRSDLRLVGSDIAPQLPQAPQGVKFRGGVAMEDLPFNHNAFGAATSQFGFEYGDVQAAASELARVVEPGGPIAIITHRIDGPILAHNLPRAKQIRWIFGELDLVETAKRSLALNTSGLAAIPSAIAEAPAIAAQKFGAGSVAWEIAEAVRQSLALGARDHPANVARLLDTIAAKAMNELGRIESLHDACRTTADEAVFLHKISQGGLEQVEARPVHDEKAGNVFADLRVFTHGA